MEELFDLKNDICSQIERNGRSDTNDAIMLTKVFVTMKGIVQNL